MSIESKIKEVLKTSKLIPSGRGGSGSINEGEGYSTDRGMVFVKRNSKPLARQMFDGEFQSLKVLHATGTVRVPEPYAVIDDPRGGAVIVMEYLDMSSLRRHAAKLGELLARLHLHNRNLEKDSSSVHQASTDEDSPSYVSKFGFHITTCCGYIAQDNTWCDDWVSFYARNKLQQQLDMIEKEYRDRETRELWSQLQLKLPNFFEGLTIKPSLLHGDLWSGNASEIDSEPVIFDPASFYGHDEFDLGIACMFGGFSGTFFKAYHDLIPKAPGFEKRSQLYQLFHNLNHWNHFGTGYKGSSLSIMRKLVKA